MEKTTISYDRLCWIQDDLMTRLTSGQIKARALPAAFASHVAALMEAGFKESEAATCFWDAVSTAEHLNAQEGTT